MKNKHLKQEINRLLTSVMQAFGKDSREYRDAEYYFDVLETVYHYNYSDGLDLLDELKNLLGKLSGRIPELSSNMFTQCYPNISEMIKCLEEWLSD